MINKLLLWTLLSIFFISVSGVGKMGDTRPFIVFIGIVLFVSYLPRTVWRIVALLLAALILLKWQFYPHVGWVNPFAFLFTLWARPLRIRCAAPRKTRCPSGSSCATFQ